MKRGDIYKHFRGERYVFICIAIPMKDEFIRTTNLFPFFDARYHEDKHNIELYTSSDGVVYINSEVPHVVYHSQKDSKMEKPWVREVDDYFGYKENKDGHLVKRFSLNAM